MWSAEQFIETLVIPFGLFTNFMALTNAFFIKNLKKVSKNIHIESFPKVSILVPARNEEKNIKKCIESMLSQDYDDFEIIALDDSSTDNTFKILEKLAEKDKRIVAVRGKPLKEGWLGKNWACFQMSKEANGEYLLFTDADTLHKSDMLNVVTKFAVKNNVDLLTGFMRQEARSIGEKVTIPMTFWGVNALKPLFLNEIAKTPKVSAAHGTFMFFKKSAYEKIGAHKAVKGEVLEDFALSQEIVKYHLKLSFLDLSGVSSCRLYTNFKDAYRGISRGVFRGIGYHIALFMVFALFLSLATLLPLLIIRSALLGDYVSSGTFKVAIFSILLLLSSWSISLKKYDMPVYLSVFYPIIISIVVLAGFRSMLLTFSGKEQWKGRELKTDRKRIKLL
jgi:chlorobactene glucosyltransferase